MAEQSLKSLWGHFRRSFQAQCVRFVDYSSCQIHHLSFIYQCHSCCSNLQRSRTDSYPIFSWTFSIAWLPSGSNHRLQEQTGVSPFSSSYWIRRHPTSLLTSRVTIRSSQSGRVQKLQKCSWGLSLTQENPLYPLSQPSHRVFTSVLGLWRGPVKLHLICWWLHCAASGFTWTAQSHYHRSQRQNA